MPTASKSIADELMQTHAELGAELRRLRRTLQASSGAAMAEVRAVLAAVQAHLAKHFAFEEQNGYMEVVGKREPKLDRSIHHLAQEHNQLRQSLEALVGKAQAATSMDDALRTAVAEWIERVRQHEVRENDLVQDAFCLDVGAED